MKSVKRQKKNIPLVYVQLKSRSVFCGYCRTERLHFYSRVYSCLSFLITSTQVSNNDEVKACIIIRLLPSRSVLLKSQTVTEVHQYWLAGGVLLIQPVIKRGLLPGHASAEATINASSLSESTIRPLKLNQVQKADNPAACLWPLNVW